MSNYSIKKLLTDIALDRAVCLKQPPNILILQLKRSNSSQDWILIYIYTEWGTCNQQTEGINWYQWKSVEQIDVRIRQVGSTFWSHLCIGNHTFLSFASIIPNKLTIHMLGCTLLFSVEFAKRRCHVWTAAYILLFFIVVAVECNSSFKWMSDIETKISLCEKWVNRNFVIFWKMVSNF